MKLWEGRFAKETDESVHAFNSSIAFDSRLYKADILGSVAHVKGLEKQGIISKEDGEIARAGLYAILDDIESGALEIDPLAEDIHTFVEGELTRRVGEAGKRIHTGRSRNDQVAFDFRWYVKNECAEIGAEIKALIRTLARMAQSHYDTVMPGYTHLQRAQPITLAHHLAAWCEMLRRDAQRLADARRRMDECPLGAGALAGTTFDLDREFTAKETGFSRITRNSLDSVADRDFALEFMAALSIHMCHISRFSEEVILWCGAEFGFAGLDDAYSTGSSIMPQKKNPDVAELTRGKSGRVFGDLLTLLTVMKGLPLAYNKDMQEDKECVFDAADTVRLCLRVFAPMLETLSFSKDAMRGAAAKGFLNATDCADYLVGKGLAFREAYNITGRLVRRCIEGGETLDTLSLDEYKTFSPLFERDVYAAINLDACVARRAVPGGPAPGAVRAHIENLMDWLDEDA
ncbi:MAG: argininosuccinate lyase [Oscillospiraceae bacterium]|jgi:argininosuccinate lyase|nr:argininosuccinate lyase [Oscillospiraceae bacterium]